MIDATEFERWMKQAEHTLESARIDMKEGYCDWACFKAHQAAEYALKALLRGLGKTAFGHSIRQLLNEVSSTGLEVSPELERAAKLLDRHYLAPRYPNQWVEGAPLEYYDEEDAKEAISKAELILNAVKSWSEQLKSA